MKIISCPDLNSWFKVITCNSCCASLEIEEPDLFCLYRDRCIGKFNITLTNGIVTYYCSCMNCDSPILVKDIPQIIQSRVKEKYPPPVKIKKTFFQMLFNL
jgi:hypothetical protein